MRTRFSLTMLSALVLGLSVAGAGEVPRTEPASRMPAAAVEVPKKGAGDVDDAIRKATGLRFRVMEINSEEVRLESVADKRTVVLR